MDLATIIDEADRFVAYVEELTSVIGHADRALPLRDYCAGLLTAEGRKSVEPMAAVTAPAQVSVQHQKLLHFVGVMLQFCITLNVVRGASTVLTAEGRGLARGRHRPTSHPTRHCRPGIAALRPA
jgi:DDE superfamily endonuclease